MISWAWGFSENKLRYQRVNYYVPKLTIFVRSSHTHPDIQINLESEPLAQLSNLWWRLFPQHYPPPPPGIIIQNLGSRLFDCTCKIAKFSTFSAGPYGSHSTEAFSGNFTRSTRAIEKIVKESLKVSKNRATKIRIFSSSEVNIACSPP
jgi:hypothetical protein